MSLPHNMNAAPGSSLDVDATKTESEYYLHDKPSTSAAGCVGFRMSSIKQEDDLSDEESLRMSTAAGDIDIVPKSIKNEEDSSDEESLCMPRGSEQVWKHIKQEPAVELPTYYGELEQFHLKKLKSPSTEVKTSSSRQEVNLSKENAPATAGAEKHFTCCECSYSTNYELHLKQHIHSKHSNDRPHSCPYCEYSTVQAGRLKLHIQAKHLNDKPHSCPYCEYSTVRAGRLKLHIEAKHLNDRPHSCPYCEYSTVRAGRLKLHIQAKHLNDRPHSCPYCEYSTVRAGRLKLHIQVKHLNDKTSLLPLL